MPKWFLINKLLHKRLTSGIVATLCLIAVIQFFASYGTYNYAYIPREDLEKNLYVKVNPNLMTIKSNPSCKYGDILKNTNSIPASDIRKNINDFSVKDIANGSYVPRDCNPLFSVAILVTYRNRQSQLEVFMPLMHNFLRKQNIHYKIYLIEQQDDKLWNKGVLYNIGAKYAIAEKFPCLILHDIDLLPLDEGNLYACLQQPRHISGSIDKFRFVLPYYYLVGGVLAIRSDQFVNINGFSNRFRGWGGEDDDFYGRISAHHLEILRFPPDLSRYTMLLHNQEPKNEYREYIISANRKDRAKDGYNSVEYSSVTVKPNVLFTVIGVKL